MRAAAPIGLAGLFGIVLFRIDMVMLAAFEPHEVVGRYGAAYRLFETTLFLSWAVGAARHRPTGRLPGRDVRACVNRHQCNAAGRRLVEGMPERGVAGG